MPALKNQKHEAFARNVGIKGMSAAKAYRTGWPKASKQSAETKGPALARSVQVKVRIEEFRQEAAARAKQKDFLSVEEKRAFLARIVRTPIGEIDQNSDLCQEYHRTRKMVGRGEDAEEWETERIKAPSKLDAIKLDNDLAVDGAEAGANKAIEIIVRKL